MNAKNFIIILSPVLICIIVFLLPSDWQNELALNSLHLNLWGWFTNVLVHYNLQHLVNNLAIYILAIISGYLILPVQGKKEFSKYFFILIFVSILFIFFIETLFRIFHFIPNVLNQRGFSGISAASLGFLCFSLSRRFQFRFGNQNEVGILLTFIYFLFLPSLALIVWNLSKVFSILVFLLWLGLILLVIWNNRKAKSTDKIAKLNWAEYILFGIIMFILFCGAYLLVPPIIKVNDPIVDIFAHLLGFISGLTTAFWFFALKNY